VNPLFSTPWLSRLAALLLLALVVFSAYLFLVEPLAVGYDAIDQEIDDSRDQLAHFERLAAMRPVVAQQLQQADSQHTGQGYYLNGGTDALAAAGLQDRINALVADNGGTLRSTQPMPGVEEQGFRRITLKVQLTATIEELFDTLYELESGAPILFVEDLDIQSRIERRKTGDKAGSNESQAILLLAVAFDLSGYLPVQPQ
jgi:general secretion pathway protein M